MITIKISLHTHISINVQTYYFLKYVSSSSTINQQANFA